MAVFWKAVDAQCGIGNFSMLISSHIHDAANRTIVKKRWQSYFKKFEVLFSRKQQGAIRIDWKIYSCISTTFAYGNNFSSGLLTFDAFNNNTFLDTIQKKNEK